MITWLALWVALATCSRDTAGLDQAIRPSAVLEVEHAAQVSPDDLLVIQLSHALLNQESVYSHYKVLAEGPVRTLELYQFVDPAAGDTPSTTEGRTITLKLPEPGEYTLIFNAQGADRFTSTVVVQ